jgi:hypothetical protein
MLESEFVTFDIEISRPFPSDGDWRKIRPLGISCAATFESSGQLLLWHGSEGPGGRLADRMTPGECADLARALLRLHHGGVEVVTWNGLGFDFDILVEECGDFPERQRVVDLAMQHTDIAFAMLCDRGFMVSLDSVAEGMRVQGKMPGMRAELAPRMWAQGRSEQEQVLAYVTQDVRSTAAVYRAVLRSRRLDWISRSGRLSSWPLPGGRIPRVLEALELPEPDTSWMSRPPWPRSRFYGWTGWESQGR